MDALSPQVGHESGLATDVDGVNSVEVLCSSGDEGQNPGKDDSEFPNPSANNHVGSACKLGAVVDSEAAFVKESSEAVPTTQEDVTDEENGGEARSMEALLGQGSTQANAPQDMAARHKSPVTAIEVPSSDDGGDAGEDRGHCGGIGPCQAEPVAGDARGSAASVGNWLHILGSLSAARATAATTAPEAKPAPQKRKRTGKPSASREGAATTLPRPASVPRPLVHRAKRTRECADPGKDELAPPDPPAVEADRSTSTVGNARSGATSAGAGRLPSARDGAGSGSARKRPRAAPVASFAFLENDAHGAVPAVSTVDTQAAQGASVGGDDKHVHGAVEAFVTIAGRMGKGGSVTRRVSIQDVERNVPVTFLPDVVPTSFADHLLRAFMEEGKRWHTSKRWLYDREIESHRLESGFYLDDPGRPGARKFSARWESAGFADDIRHLRDTIVKAVQRARLDLREAALPPGTTLSSRPPMSACELAQETVALASRGQRLNTSSAEWLVWYAQDAAKQGGWRWQPNYCVANLYKDQGDFLGAHSDPVESIGPWAIVASLTFGAARHFRMKPVGTVWADAGKSGEARQLGGGGRVTSYSVRLPHNSLLICWEGFQEFWRHEVPKDNGLTEHPISGPTRLNFTFRKSISAVAKRRPVCGCGRRAHLKPVLKETSRHRGRYFWSCSNPRVRKGEYSTCKFFRWDDEVIAESVSGTASANSLSSSSPASSAGANWQPRLLRVDAKASAVAGAKRPPATAPATTPSTSGVQKRLLAARNPFVPKPLPQLPMPSRVDGRDVAQPQGSLSVAASSAVTTGARA